ncbi:MAG: hypothetical protein JOZ59_05005, partial [Candidatus Eremiobacteraeota bacterium]|nr:hypothetical protein [Candidatus Eremiobacteraeota bacterium]
MIRNDDLGYPIVIGQAIRSEMLRFARERDAPVIVLADENVASFAEHFTLGVRNRMPIRRFTLGESRKTFSTIERVIDALIDAGVE